eukprot:CAMPEP_0183714276 /NCGR_PEP_ID=MMETSP0737-20130205/8854_1 /TAXON_ID=385413 /ORGANISM="Thalassiosira miniscula, Strain CCMP1093" /LENGTH=204 /DNA_ID=CAMNT_0025943183 /DNA_START=20 /DNA_END=634 /DNA_ORIENTATION=+
MMKTALIASLAATATAFAPVQQISKATTSLNAFENELGVQAPLGLFDPLGMLDGASQEKFDRLRYVEIKHGRIAQLAFLGQIWARGGNRLDGPIDNAGDLFTSYPNGLAALFGPNAIPQLGLTQIIIFIGILETCVMTDWTESAEFPGDLRNGTFQGAWDNWSDKEKLQKRAVELNNGRAAMMGILGLMVHEQLGTDMPIIGQL